MVSCFSRNYTFKKCKAFFIAVLAISSSSNAEQFVANVELGLHDRVLVRGEDYIRICSEAASSVESGKQPKIDGCLLYTEGLRTGYGKATTEVIAKAALLNVSKEYDDWEKALSSPFYIALSNEMIRCNLGVSTPSIVVDLSQYIQANRLQSDVMASIFYDFLKDGYKECD
ncbi:hypothetical protein [Alloalcanivorax venustensis]|uniref:hypothetical protein n=1 Tax=Alloalcanivorax venustensis TaxID=172371 RepID=UPI002B0BDBF0|nr:hypothetical protein [Pseudomonadota bacterium]